MGSRQFGFAHRAGLPPRWLVTDAAVARSSGDWGGKELRQSMCARLPPILGQDPLLGSRRCNSKQVGGVSCPILSFSLHRTHEGGLNSKLHAVCDGQGRPVVLLLTEGQMSDHKGAALPLPALPVARELLGDRGYDSSRSVQRFVNVASRHASHPPGSARSLRPMTRSCIGDAIASRTPLAASKIGAASPCVTTDAPTPSSQPFALPQPSVSGCATES
jgi:hypothetical protein